jgi:anti-sigma factor RsiW
MNCAEVETLVAAHADGEVDMLRGRAVERHLHGCFDCRAAFERVLALRAGMRAEVPYFTASPALRARVLAITQPASARVAARAPHVRDRWRWLAGGVLAGSMASVFAWIVGTAVITARANDDTELAAVASHVRATLGDHLIEVASSDRHTVKPWLSARLDYSPPVQDLAGEGYPLVGGRLDELDRQRVATLVYHYRQHTIDVFVRPEGAHAQAPALRTVRGFNVAHANGPTMEWLAVSDAEPAVVAALVQRLAREDPAR